MPEAYPSRDDPGDTTIASLSDGMCCIEGGPASPVGSWAPGSKGTGERADPRPRNVTGAAARVTQAVTALSTTSQSVTKRPAPSLEIRTSTHPCQVRGRWAVTSRATKPGTRASGGKRRTHLPPLPAFSFLPSFLSGSLCLPTPVISLFLPHGSLSLPSISALLNLHFLSILDNKCRQ